MSITAKVTTFDPNNDCRFPEQTRLTLLRDIVGCTQDPTKYPTSSWRDGESGDRRLERGFGNYDLPRHFLRRRLP